MTISNSRARLLGGAAIGLGLTMAATQPAQAACTLTSTNIPSDTVSCTTTTTTDTTYPTNVPNDRHYEYVADAPLYATVGSGAVVDGFGLALTDIGVDTSSLSVTNAGSVIVNAGNTPTAGGNSAALYLSSVNTSLIYGGTGDITNLGTGDGLGVAISGTGDLSANIGGSVRAENGDAIRVVSTAPTGGSIGIITTAGETVRASAGDGIDIDTAGSGDVGIINAAAISSGAAGVNTLQDGIGVTSTGTGDITINNSATIGAAGDRAQLTGISATVANAASAGALSVAGTGAIFSVGNAIDVSTTGSGTASVVYGGALDTTAGDGIQVDTTTGAITVASGGAITAAAGNGIATTSTSGSQTISANAAIMSSTETILATSGTGDITVNVNGDLTTTGAGDVLSTDTAGTAVVNVAAGTTATGAGGDVVNFYGTGTATLNNSGTIGDAGSNRAVYTDSTEQVTINNLASGTINGNYDLSDLGDTITNSGTLNLRGTSNFYTGTDVITNNAGATITAEAGTVLTGLETLNNAGTLTAASGLTFDGGDTALTNTGTVNLAGTLDLGAGTDSFANSGAGIVNITGDATLAGAETVTNAGRINLNTFTLTGPAVGFTNTGTIDTSGSASLAGFTTLDNAGTLDLAAGVFTAPAGVFTNSGTILADEGATTITGQTRFANTGTIDLQDGVVDDVLTIDSDFAGSGGSTLMLDVDDDAGDQLVIAGAASGSTAIDANLIGTGILIADGVLLVDAGTSTDGAFSLGGVSGNTSPLLDYSLEQRDADYFLTTQVNEAGFTPVPVTQVAGEMWYQSAEAVRAQTKLPDDGTDGMKLWAQVYGSRDKAGGHDRQTINGDEYDVDNRLDTDRLGFQVGAGFGMGMGSIGVTGGLERADAHGDASDYEARGWNIGAYGMFGAPTGVHGALLVKHDRFDIDMGNGLFEGIEPDGRSTGVDGEIGYRFGGTSGPAFGVSAGLAHVRTKIDDFSLAGLEYDYDSMTSTRGRVGVRATGNGPLSPFVDVRGYHEFSGDGDVHLSDGIDSYRLNAEGRGTWARVEAGIGGPASGLAPMVSAWVDFGDVKGFGGRGSFRF